MLVVRVLIRILVEMVIGAGHVLRFVVMRKSVKRRVHELLACGRGRVSGACLAALALLCASCGMTGGVQEIGGTLEEIVGGGYSALAPVESAAEILSPAGSMAGVISVFDETVFECRYAPEVLGTVGEIMRPSDEGLLWTITEILRL